MLNDRLKILRERTGLSARKFAECIDVKYTTYYGYESGSREPGSDFITRMADYFNVSTDYILCRTDIEFEPVQPYTQNDRLSAIDLIVARAYHNADVGTQSSVKKLLDVTDANDEELAIEREVASYRAELEAEAKGAAKSKASQTSKGA